MGHQIVYNLKDIAAGVCSVPSNAPERIAVISDVDNAKPFCPPQTNATTIDSSLIKSAVADTVEFTITNASDETQRVLFGTVAGFEGANVRYGLEPSAVDEPLVSDQFGANIQKVQGFNGLVVPHSMLTDQIEIFTENESQRAQRFTELSLDYDANNCSKKGSIPWSSSFDNGVRFEGLTVFSATHGLYYPVLAGQTVSVQFRTFAIASGENYVNVV